MTPSGMTLSLSFFTDQRICLQGPVYPLNTSIAKGQCHTRRSHRCVPFDRKPFFTPFLRGSGQSAIKRNPKPSSPHQTHTQCRQALKRATIRNGGPATATGSSDLTRVPGGTMFTPSKAQSASSFVMQQQRAHTWFPFPNTQLDSVC